MDTRVKQNSGKAQVTVSQFLKDPAGREAATNLERIKPEELNRIWDQATLEDIEYLAREFPERVQVDCVACDSSDYHAGYQKLGYIYNRCNVCNSLFISPRLTKEGTAYFFRHSSYTKLAESVYQAVAAERKRIIFEPVWKKLKELLLQLGASFPIENVLEVGASLGLLASVVVERQDVINFDAIEPSGSATENLKRVGIRNVYAGMEEDYVGKLSPVYDIVLCHSVIEVTFSPKEFMLNLKTFLKPSGFLVISSAGASGVDSLILQQAQQNVDPPHGQNYLSNQGIRRLAERCGFRLSEFASIGQLDVDILYHYLSRQETTAENPWRMSALRMLENAELRQDLQAVLQKHHLTGFYLAILKPE